MQGDGTEVSDASPEEGPYWSLMFEVSESVQFKPVDQSPVTVGGKTWPALVRDTIVGAINTKLIQNSDQIVSIYHRCAGLRACHQLT